MTQNLIVTFGKGDGSTHDWTYKGLDPNLSAPEIKDACELLTNLDISTQNGVKLFDSVITAKVVEHIETLMFDSEHETKGITYYGKPAQEPTCEEVRCFEVAEEKEESDKAIQTKKKPALMAPLLPLMDFAKHPYERRFKKLANAENTETSVRVEKDSLPQSKSSKHLEQLIDKGQKQDSAPIADSDHPSSTSSHTRAGWLQRIFRRKSRNKEDPKSTPNDPISRE